MYNGNYYLKITPQNCYKYFLKKHGVLQNPTLIYET